MTEVTHLMPDGALPANRPAGMTIITTMPEPAIGEIANRGRRREPGTEEAQWNQGLRNLSVRLAQLPVLTTFVLGLLAVNLALIGFRDRIAHAVPLTAGLYAAIGLPAGPRGPTIEDVTTTMTRRDGMPTLMIQGKITSRAPQSVDVPRLNFAILNARGSEIVTWSTLPSREQLAAGATLEFASQYAVPPGDSHEVVVRFSSRSSALARSR